MSRAFSLSRTLITLHKAGICPRVTYQPDGSVIFDLSAAANDAPVDAMEAEAAKIDRLIHEHFGKKVQKSKHI